MLPTRRRAILGSPRTEVGLVTMTTRNPDDLWLAFAETRDPEIRDVLITTNVPLAKFVATKMFNLLPDGTDKQDVVSMATLGLIDAVDKFDPMQGIRFSTYAVIRIRGAVLDGMQRAEWAPKSVATNVRKFRRAIVDLASELGHQPSDEELAVYLELSLQEIRALRLDGAVVKVRSIEQMMHVDEDGEDSDSMGMPSVDAEQEVQGEIAEIGRRIGITLSDLSVVEQELLLLHHRDRMSLKEAALQLGISSAKAFATHAAVMDRVVDRLRNIYGEMAS